MMKLRGLILVALITSLIGIAGGCQPAGGGVLTDDFGREVKIERPPQRIVTHVPGITEILFALHLDERVVGVSSYCDYPEAARQKPKIGGFADPSLEKIAELKPDFVLTNGFVDYLMPQLDQLGISYAVLQPVDINGILSNIRLVGKIAGIDDQAEGLVKDLESRLSDVSQRVKDASRPRVFYIIDATDLNNPWTAGPGSFVDSIIRLAGGENVGAKASAQWAQFSIEEVVNSDPELIILDAIHGTAVVAREKLEAHPVWREMAAVKQGKVYTIDGDLVDRNGPRIIQGLEEMAKTIHPELF